MNTAITLFVFAFVLACVALRARQADALLPLAGSTVEVAMLGLGISDCQGQDAALANLLYANGSQGSICDPGAPFTVEIRPDRSMHSFTIKKPKASGGYIGNGRYVVYLNVGGPSASTITS